MQTGVRDLLDDPKNVQLRQNLSHGLEQRVHVGFWQRRRSSSVQSRFGVLKVAPGDALVVGNVESLHDLFSGHERLGRLLGDLGRLDLVSRAVLVVGCRPVERVGEVGVVQPLHLFLTLLLEEELQRERTSINMDPSRRKEEGKRTGSSVFSHTRIDLSCDPETTNLLCWETATAQTSPW